METYYDNILNKITNLYTLFKEYVMITHTKYINTHAYTQNENRVITEYDVL